MAQAKQEAIVQKLPGPAPCCSVSVSQLRRLPAGGRDDDAAQRRFEQICARELLGDTD